MEQHRSINNQAPFDLTLESIRRRQDSLTDSLKTVEEFEELSPRNRRVVLLEKVGKIESLEDTPEYRFLSEYLRLQGIDCLSIISKHDKHHGYHFVVTADSGFKLAISQDAALPLEYHPLDSERVHRVFFRDNIHGSLVRSALNVRDNVFRDAGPQDRENSFDSALNLLKAQMRLEKKIKSDENKAQKAIEKEAAVLKKELKKLSKSDTVRFIREAFKVRGEGLKRYGRGVLRKDQSSVISDTAEFTKEVEDVWYKGRFGRQVWNFSIKVPGALIITPRGFRIGTGHRDTNNEDVWHVDEHMSLRTSGVIKLVQAGVTLEKVKLAIDRLAAQLNAENS